MHTILVADDSVTIQRAVEIAFDKEPFRVVKAGSGAEAIAQARQLRPHLVLADHLMPDQSGYEVAEALRADPSTQAIPVLILSGSSAPFDENRAAGAGVAGHIAKPFDCQSLLDRVRGVLGASPAAMTAAPAVLIPTAAAIPLPPGMPPPPQALPRPPAGPPRTATPLMTPAVPPAAVSPPAVPTLPPPGIAAPSFAVPSFGMTAPVAPPVAVQPAAAPSFAAPTWAAPASAAPMAAAPMAAAPMAAAPMAAAPMAAVPVAAAPMAAAPVAAAPSFAAPSFAAPSAGEQPSWATPVPPATPAAAPGALAAPSWTAPRTGGDDVGTVSAEGGDITDLEPADIVSSPSDESPPVVAPLAAVVPMHTEALDPASMATPVLAMPAVRDLLSVMQAPAPEPELAPLPSTAEMYTAAVVEAAAPLVAATGTTASRGTLTEEARQIVERIAWEIIPELAETIIREEIQRLMKSR